MLFCLQLKTVNQQVDIIPEAKSINAVTYYLRFLVIEIRISTQTIE